MKRRLLGILLTLAMVLTMMPAAGAAAYAETPETDYLTFTALEDGASVSLDWASATSVEYRCIRSGRVAGEWMTYSQRNAIALFGEGDSVQFRGSDVATDYNHHFNIAGKVAASGSVASLTNGQGKDPYTRLSDYCYDGMFYNCTGLVTAPKLPAVKLERFCYRDMFFGCSNLTAAPDLPATTLAPGCYYNMFTGCESLKNAPDLPATTLANECYSGMFRDCRNLTDAPDLPATTLAKECYSCMFRDCKNLTDAPDLPAVMLTKGCYYQMFAGCESLENAPELPAEELTVWCYYQMFDGCSGIKMYPDYSVDHASEWSIPAGAETAEDWNYEMFAGTGCDFMDAPDIGTVYYQSKPDPVASVELSPASFTYSGEENRPAVTVKSASGKVLTEGRDCTVVCPESCVNAGSYVVAVTGIGDFAGTVETTFVIKPRTGWQKIDGYWYYYEADGANGSPATNKWMQDSKGWCWLQADGRMLTNGWAKDSKGWCWMGADGYWVSSKWIKDGGSWYYIKSDHYMASSEWRQDSKGWCYLGSSGKMVTNGWAKDSKGWCWMGSDGYWVSNKWVKDGGQWYYIKPNHYMACNEWAKDSGGWMWMNASGKITKSKWVKDGSYWYYLKSNGYMATGTQTIDGKTCKFDSSGRWIQ